MVKAGQVLMTLYSPKLEDDIRLSEKRLELYRLRLERAATSRETSADMRVAMQQWSAESAHLDGVKQQRERLVIRAPFDGKVMELDNGLHRGRWIDTVMPLLTLVAPERAVVNAAVTEDVVAALSVGQDGFFVSEDAWAKSTPVRVAEIGSVNLHQFDSPDLASVYGGNVPVRVDASGKLIPTNSVFTVRLKIDSLGAPDRTLRGTAVINGKPRSLAGRLFDTAVAVLIRESGF
jgi:putative peptide zinc metalloprotease protein